LFHLVDDHDVSHAHIRLTGVVARRVVGTVGVHHHNEEIRSIERHVVVPAVPDHDVGLLLGLPQDPLVVHACIHHGTGPQVRLEFLALLDGDVMSVQVLELSEALHGLLGQVAIGHGVAHDDHPLPHFPQDCCHPATRLALACSGARRADGNHGHLGVELRVAWAQEHVVGAGRHDLRPHVHHVLVRYVAVAEHGEVDLLVPDQPLQLVLRLDGDAFGIARPRELGGVQPPLDVRDLGGRERHHLEIGILPEERVEVVEVPPCRPKNHDALRHKPRSLFGSLQG
jgi:hypothetical protein